MDGSSTGDETGSVSPQVKKSLLSAVVRVAGKAVYGAAAGFKAQWSRLKPLLHAVAAYVAPTENRLRESAFHGRG